jgi:ribulose-5-phosphate 4-epimerase/fuculose-1-phosphate aldolase
MASSVPAASPALIEELVVGNRILFERNVVDAFGHISVRHDKDPSKFLLSRHRAPGLVSAEDLITYDLDCNPLDNKDARQYGEKWIHGEIYRARPDVIAVVHCHAPALIPFGATRNTLKPLYHMSGFLGEGVAHFEIRDTAGPTTDMLIRTQQLGKALAGCLADKPMVLMRGHGATMAGKSIQQVVYRSIYAALNASLQMEAVQLGEPIYLEREEARKAAATNDGALDRAWALWQREAMGK